MRKVIVVDWLDTYGGAERVIKSFCNIFTFERCYCLVNVMGKKDSKKIFSNQQGVQIEQTLLKRLKSKFRWSFMTFHFFVNKIKIDRDADLIISSSHSVAKGINKSREGQLHVSYFQARNFKYIWADYELYFGKLGGYFMLPIIFILRRIDRKHAKKPDFIIANSHYVKNWVKETYNRDSDVVYPPVDLSNFKIETNKSNFYVAVGRLEPYKRFDLIIDAFNRLDDELMVIGDGSQLADLKTRANDNIKFLGFLESEQIVKYVSRARGFIHAGVEDFGIAPIEAQACGTPVIGYNAGGLTETVIHGETGFLFNEQTSECLVSAIQSAKNMSFNCDIIRENSLRFSEERFELEFKNKVETLYNNWNKKIK